MKFIHTSVVKDIKPLKKRKKATFRGYLILATLITALLLVIVGTISISTWFDTHKIVFNQPVKVSFSQPVEIKERKPQIIEKKLVLDYPDSIDTPIEKYICDKFGVYDCKTALAVSKAENGTRQADRFGINTNGTIDVGIFQINSVHFNKPGCSLAEIVDAYKNIDCAYTIYKEQGNWSAWVTYQNGNYLASFDK